MAYFVLGRDFPTRTVVVFGSRHLPSRREVSCSRSDRLPSHRLTSCSHPMSTFANIYPIPNFNRGGPSFLDITRQTIQLRPSEQGGGYLTPPPPLNAILIHT